MTTTCRVTCIRTSERRPLPASTTTIANQSQSPRLPLATAAAAAREEVRPWDRDWTTPASAHVETEEGALGLEVGGGRQGQEKGG